MGYGYFYDTDGEKFSFYRLPKSLFTDPKLNELSDSAKILYGLMLDRVDLSCSHNLRDKKGRLYIVFTINQIMDAMRCSRQKATVLLKELEDKANLIEKVKQGLGKPTRIYVKDFSVKTQESVDKYNGSEEIDAEKPESKNQTSGSLNIRLAESKNQTSGSLNIRLQEVYKLDSINTDINNTDYNNTEIDIYNNINNKSSKIIYVENEEQEGGQVEKPKVETSKEEKPEVEKPKEEVSIAKPPAKKNSLTYSDDFLRFWAIYPRKDTKSETFKCFKARMKEGFSPDDMVRAAEIYAEECERQHKEREFTLLPKTFLGCNLRFQDYLDRDRDKKPLKKHFDKDENPFGIFFPEG